MTDLERIALNMIADRAAQSLQDRADREDWRDWTWPDSYRRYVALLRTGRAWVGANGSVFCRVTGPDALARTRAKGQTNDVHERYRGPDELRGHSPA